MDAKKLTAGTVVGGLTFMVLGYLLYGLMMKSFMASNTITSAAIKADADLDFVMLFLGSLAWAGTLAYIFQRWAGIKTFSTGAKAGAILGALIGAAMNFETLGTMNILNTTGHITAIIIEAVRFAIVGGVIGQVVGMMTKEGAKVTA